LSCQPWSVRFIDSLGAEQLAVSAQSVESKSAFTRKFDLRFPLRADAGKVTASAHGILGPIGVPRRSIFIADGMGIVRYAHRFIAGLNYRPTDGPVEVHERL
jgi:peroxiredoxin Q/BCP